MLPWFVSIAMSAQIHTRAFTIATKEPVPMVSAVSLQGQKCSKLRTARVQIILEKIASEPHYWRRPCNCGFMTSEQIRQYAYREGVAKRPVLGLSMRLANPVILPLISRTQSIGRETTEIIATFEQSRAAADQTILFLGHKSRFSVDDQFDSVLLPGDPFRLRDDVCSGSRLGSTRTVGSE